jgi:flavin-dependent dehydrogenase
MALQVLDHNNILWSLRQVSENHLAYLLGRDGCEVLLFDAREPWEKPCGGGVTSKALREFEFLLDGETPRQMVSSLRLISARGREAHVHPRQDFAIYARVELDRMMRRRAVSSGAELHCARVERIRRSAGKWEIFTARNGEFTCDFLVGADGATSTTRRRLGIRFAPQDFAYSLGWRVKHIDNGHHTAAAAQADIKYLDGLTGYLWAFPRTDHVSYGIVTKYGEATPAALKERLLDLIESQSPPITREIRASTHHSTPRAAFYGAMIPALEAESWDRLTVCNAGHAWALIGDAAGFADPITGEGIYLKVTGQSITNRAASLSIRDKQATVRQKRKYLSVLCVIRVARRTNKYTAQAARL